MCVCVCLFARSCVLGVLLLLCEAQFPRTKRSRGIQSIWQVFLSVFFVCMHVHWYAEAFRWATFTRGHSAWIQTYTFFFQASVLPDSCSLILPLIAMFVLICLFVYAWLFLLDLQCGLFLVWVVLGLLSASRDWGELENLNAVLCMCFG